MKFQKIQVDTSIKIKTGEGAVKEQTNPPTFTVREIYPEENYPKGRLDEYLNENSFRTTSEEKRLLEMGDFQKRLKALRRAAEVHRQVRQFANSFIKPGIKLWDMCSKMEDMSRKLIEEDGLNAGLAFPTGCSINRCAAHYSPNKGDNTVLRESDVMKIDFGTHVDGYLIDSAYTVCFDPRFDTLLKASKEATYTAVNLAGIDARLSELGEAIEEVITSYELELNGKTYKIKPVSNLGGHSVEQYKIHAGLTVPLVRGGETTKMKEGQIFAIETFASTGTGVVEEEGDCSHYMVKSKGVKRSVNKKSSKRLKSFLLENYGTMAFCPRWIDRLNQKNYYVDLKNLVRNKIVGEYPPLCDTPDSYVSQYEHTIILRPTCKEVLSWGDDY
ncbi:methionine aminopeptidase [Anaeramoeba flamelloides]|uniref:Methionine aminopeptidase 2 n=1 Tax=Anaeramoeba flamelloides TaxID=1746091 RepID=A0AAV7YZJ3_9EUKA|nr:methionine aminopeptidase [Anaeramoeba flamelloides]